MNLSTEPLRRYLRTLEAALLRYEAAPPDSLDREVFQNAIIQGYELTQETAFKLVRRALRDFGHGARRIDATPVKDLLRLAATHGLMTVEEVARWFAYRDNRNDTAHDYGVGFAEETLTLLPAFVADAHRLEAALGARFPAEDAR